MLGKIKKIICDNVEDLFIVVGLLIVLGTTFYIAPVIGFYLLGAVLIATGIVMSIHYQRIRGNDR